MTLEQQGLYLRYCVLHMRDGSISANARTRATLAGISVRTDNRLWPAIGAKFRPDSRDLTRLVNDKCLAELDRIDRFREQQAAKRNGAESGRNPTQPELNLDSTPVKPKLNSDSTPANPLQSTNDKNHGFTSQSQSQSQSQNTLKGKSSGTTRAAEDPSLSPKWTADRPTDQTWEPAEHEAVKLADLMAKTTGKRDESFALEILNLAAGGSARSYAQVAACVRDAAANATTKPRKNGFFKTAVEKQFASGIDLTKAAKTLDMNRSLEPARKQRLERARERNRKQIDCLAEQGATTATGFVDWMREHEPRSSVQ